MDWAKNSIKKLETAIKSLGKRSGPYITWLKEKEDDSKLRVCDYALKNGIPTFSAALNDLEEGLACLAGKPNCGKSTILVNMMMQACQLNDDILILDISLDDPYKKRFEQYIASLTGLYYQEITTKTNLSDEKIKLKKEAESQLIEWYRADKLRTIEAIERYEEDDITITRHYREPEEIFRLMREVRTQYPDKKIVVFLDAWNNLDMTKARASSDLSQANYYLSKFQEESNKLGIVVMLSAHLRKPEKGRRRPGLEDIKGTSDMAYNVVWAGIVINELRENAIKDPLVFKEGDKLYPIVVIEVVKTKVSTWDLPLMYVLKSGQCGLLPLHRYQYEDYKEIYTGIRK
jgi:hypothetical protein